MKALLLFVSICLAGMCIIVPALAQQRYLVSPNDEVIPLRKNQSAALEIQKRMYGRHRNGQAVSDDACGSKFTFGYTLNDFPPSINFGALHKDVLGQWYVAKASGTIDTLFWCQYERIGALDSTVVVRIHESRIGPDFGPGSPSTHWWRPPCQNWGYWPNSQDLDQGIAPFQEEAYPIWAVNWISTYNNPPGPSTPPVDPYAKWGYAGVSVKVHPNSVNFLALASVQPCSVTIGEKFFISMKVNSLNTHVLSDTRTEWFAWGDRVSKTDENYPSRNWKFYEHDAGPSNCSGVPIPDVKRGWVARGGFGPDSLDVGAWNWWYVMTVTSNMPPKISDKQVVYTTLDTGPQRVLVEATDCNPAHPESAGVASAVVGWALNDIPQPSISMMPLGGGYYEAYIPGCPTDSRINYFVEATDLNGAEAHGMPHAYSIIGLRNQYYLVDTLCNCTPKSIAGNGTIIDTNQFFLPPYDGHGTNPMDNGTAGPYEIPGGPMTFFGQESLRYLWVGINGGIALGKNASDTIDVNANGQNISWHGVVPYDPWRFPWHVHHYRQDMVNIYCMPPNFIAPMWADFIYADTAHTQRFGRILRGSYSGNPSCEYIVEWDSLGTFDQDNPLPDICTFRVVLNRCDGTIEFQYDNVGTNGQDSAALVGMQADWNSLTAFSPGSVPGYVFINRVGYPAQLRPRNNWCIKFYPGAAYYANDEWNLISIPTIPYENDYRVSSLFPYAKTAGGCGAYVYTKKYVETCTMSNGLGYWVKFDGRPYASVGGYSVYDVTVPVTNGWNLVGSIMKPIVTGTIVRTSTTVRSKFYWYDGSTYVGYDQNSGTLLPGHGHWVKVSGDGSLQMAVPPSAEPKVQPVTDEFAQLNRIIVRDAVGHYQTLYLGDEGMLKNALDMYELPPPAPAFDARFSSQRMVEVYPAVLDKKATYSYPITVQSSLYPITVEWDIVRPTEQEFLLTSGKGELISVMEGKGSARITDPQDNELQCPAGRGECTKSVCAGAELSQSVQSNNHAALRVACREPSPSNHLQCPRSNGGYAGR